MVNATSAASASTAEAPTFSLEGERREVTILFADLVGSTELAERIGDEAVYALTREVFADLVGMVEVRGGRLAEFSGDGLMAIFGGPVALDDAALVACRTAAEMVRSIASRSANGATSRDWRLQLRVGISTGTAVVGEIGLPRKIDLTAIGDTVNLAARLQQLAGPDEIVVDSKTHSLVAPHVVSTALGQKAIRGRKARVSIFKLVAVQQHTSRFDRPVHARLRLVGRSDELNWLLRQRESARRVSRFVGIIGEAGIGKSRLVAELRTELGEDEKILVGNCLPDGREAPYLPVIDILRQSLKLGGDEKQDIESRIAASLGPALASNDAIALLMPLLGATPPTPVAIDPALAGIRLRELLFDWMDVIRSSDSCVILFEDVHWIDRPSRELVERLANAPAGAGLVLWTSRADGRPDWSQAEVRHLSGLDATATVALICDRLEVTRLPDAFERFLISKSSGNPLFAEAITNLLVERGDLLRSDDGVIFTQPPDDALPPGTVQNLIVERVDRLPLTNKRLLQTASVIGRGFSAELLSDVVRYPMPSLRPSLVDLANKGFLTHRKDGGDMFEFQHALVRDVLYGSLLDADKAMVHARVAECLEHREGDSVASAPVLAHHYARSQDWAKAIRYLTAAGRAALATYSIEDASRSFGLAMARVESDPTMIDTAFLAELLQSWMRVLELEGRFGDIREQAERHLPRIGSGPVTPATILVLIHYAHALAHAHRYDDAHAMAKEAIAKGEEIGDELVVAAARLILMKVVAKTRIGVAEDSARDLGTQVLPIAAKQTDGHLELLTLFELANNEMHRGLVHKARRSIESLIQVGERRKDPRARAFSRWMLGWLNLQEGRYEDAYADALASEAASLTRTDTLMATVVRGAALALLGRSGEAITALDEVRKEAATNADFNIVSAVDSVLGVALALSGRLADGVKRISRSIARGEATGYLTSAAYGRLTLGEIYVALASRQRKSSIGDILRNIGFLIAAMPRAGARAQQLFRLVEDSGQFEPGGIVSVRVGLGRGLLAVKKRPTEAREYLEKARRDATAIGANVYAERAATALANLTRVKRTAQIA